MFRKILLTRDLSPETISGICADLGPFCEYLTEIHGITDIAGISRSHVQAYVTAVGSVYEEGGRRPGDALGANMLLTALNLMCLYLYRAGVVAEDYGQLVAVIPLPDRPG